MQNRSPRICVAGSLNVDQTIRLERFHHPGETVTAKSIVRYAGGKGGNQAVAVAKLGFEVLMVGMLGEDENGRFYHQVLAEHGVNAACVGDAPDVPTGMAIIEVDDSGENRIAIIPGTNALVDNAYIDRVLPEMMKYDIFLLQFEIAIETVCYLAKRLREAGKIVILDPAPAMQAPRELYENVDYLTPNKTELATLAQMPVDSMDEVRRATQKLLDWGVGAVIAKLGAQGCMYIDRNTELSVRGFSVRTVDTTAAGDSFNAGFATALAQKLPVADALRFANAVGALSTMGAGAQASMPTLKQVEELLTQS